MHAGCPGQAQQLHLRRGGLPERPQVRERIPGGDDAQAVAGGGQALEQRGDALVLELARRGRGGRVLQRLEAVEDEEAAPLADEAGEALAFLERAGGAGGECLSASSPKKVRASLRNRSEEAASCSRVPWL